MNFVYHTKGTGYPSLIRILQLTVLILSVGSALWFDFFSAGTLSLSPFFLLLSPELSFKLCIQVFTAPFLLFYPGTSLNLFFDLVVINALVTPIYTFVLSFVGSRNFIGFLIGLIAVGVTGFLSFALQYPTAPCSLFSSLTFAIIIFWAMLHSKGQSFFLLAFPISPLLFVSVAAGATLYPIFLNGEWAKFTATLLMVCASYLFAVMRFHLRSNIKMLQGIEDFLDKAATEIYRFWQWNVLRLFRK